MRSTPDPEQRAAPSWVSRAAALRQALAAWPRRRLLAAATVVLVGGGLVAWSPWGRSGGFVVAGYLPINYYSADSLGRAVDEGLTEVSPIWATLRADGTLEKTTFTSAVREQLQRPGIRVLPTVQNYADEAWQGDLVAELVDDPDWVEDHVDELVDAAVENGWDGIDIDYEALPPEAGEKFTNFLTDLAEALHAQELILSVAVPARASNEETWTLAYSYERLGQIADQVRVMAYDHAWSGSLPGPVAPLPWVEDVVTYSAERIPRDKLMLGVATYGYDWVGSQGTYLTTSGVFELANEMGAVPRWDPTAAASMFDYQVEGERHTVWYEDARSLEAKLEVALGEELRGIAFWQIGGEDPGVWGVVADIAAD